MARIDYALLADHVRQEGGLSHVLAANINSLSVEEVPAPWNLGILVVVHLDEEEQLGDTVDLQIRFRTAGGEELAQINATIAIEDLADQPPGWPRRAVMALNFGLMIPDFGYYAFDLAVAGETQRTLDVRVVRPQVQTDGP